MNNELYQATIYAICLAGMGLPALCQAPGTPVRTVFLDIIDKSSGAECSERSQLYKAFSAAPEAEVAEALPLVMGLVLRGEDGAVSDCALSALITVSLRPDSPDLLQQHLATISKLLDSGKAPMQRVAVAIFAAVQSRRPPTSGGSPPALTQFLKRTDRDLQAQASAVATLARGALDSDAVNAIDRFLARDLDGNTRVVSLFGLSSPNVSLHPALVSRVVTLLTDGDNAVRSTAIDALTRMGPQALAMAGPALSKVAEDPKASDRVRSAARVALQKIGRKVE